MPALISAVEERRVDRRALTARDAIVALRLDLAAVLDSVLPVLPQTRQVFVILGNSPLERLWAEGAAKDLQPFAGRVDLEWSTTLSLAAILDRAAALP